MTAPDSGPDTSSPLGIELDSRGETTVVRVTGAAGADVSAQMNRTIQEAAQTGPVLLAIDLSGLSFISSTGLGGLVGAHVSMERDGVTMCLVNPHKMIREVLEVTRLNTLFRVVDTLEEAEQLASQRPAG